MWIMMTPGLLGCDEEPVPCVVPVINRTWTDRDDFLTGDRVVGALHQLQIRLTACNSDASIGIALDVDHSTVRFRRGRFSYSAVALLDGSTHMTLSRNGERLDLPVSIALAQGFYYTLGSCSRSDCTPDYVFVSAFSRPPDGSEGTCEAILDTPGACQNWLKLNLAVDLEGRVLDGTLRMGAEDTWASRISDMSAACIYNRLDGRRFDPVASSIQPCRASEGEEFK